MAYELTWYIPDKVLLLEVSGDYTLKDAEDVDELMHDKLNHSQKQLLVLINAMKMDRPYNFNQIRLSQTYMDHRQLKSIYVASGDRLVKLAMMVIFNLSRARLLTYDSLDNAMSILQSHLNAIR